MEKDPTKNPGGSGVKMAEKKSEDHYEIELDEHGPANIDEAFKDAVAAVDRVKKVEHVSDGELADRVSSNAPASASSDGEVPDQEPPDAGRRSSRVDPTGRSSSRVKVETETDGLRERLMRTLADFDNYRKRTEREKQALRRFANFDIFKDFLGVLDNLERAMESSGSAEDLKQGLRMIVRQHEEILSRHGVERVEAVDKAFDPTVHEAVVREESAEVEVPTVTKEMQRGYLLHDRLLRPALVFVAMPGGRSADDRSADDRSADDGGAVDDGEAPADQ